MRKRRWRKLPLFVLLALLLAMFAPSALAADDDEDQPWYDVPAIESKRAWVPWIAAFLFTAGCALIAFKNPHRTHLD